MERAVKALALLASRPPLEMVAGALIFPAVLVVIAAAKLIFGA